MGEKEEFIKMTGVLDAINLLTIDSIVKERLAQAAECPFRRCEDSEAYCQLKPYTNRLKTPLLQCDYQTATVIFNERHRPYHKCLYTPHEISV